MNPAQHVLLLAVRLYRWAISPALTTLFGPAGGCRYTPTCSQYFIEAVRRRGALRGGAMGLWRILRCNPFCKGGYDPVAEIVFNETNVDGYFLEYDSDRAGSLEPLRLVPKGKKVVLGLVSTKTPVLESKDDLKRRIAEAAKYVPIENLCISPQCGFASSHHGNLLSEDDQWKKLSLVVEVAREVWGGS